MTKQFFTKWIAVSGEIKEGDKYINPKMGGIILTRSHGNNDESYEGFQKVKLFLCSKDIKEDDKVYPTKYYHKAGSVVGKFKEGSKDVFYFKGHKPVLKNYHHRNNWGKIVGELSPDAEWVKEGDEFDDYKVMNSYGEIFDSGLFKNFVEGGYEYRIAVKGPCGHYH